MRKIRTAWVTKALTAVTIGIAMINAVGTTPINADSSHRNTSAIYELADSATTVSSIIRSAYVGTLYCLPAGTKSYTYKSTKYTLVKNATTYTGGNFNQFTASNKKVMGNAGCASVSCACALSIMKGKKLNPTSYWTKGQGCILSKYGSIGTVNSNEKAILKQAATLINSGKPSVLQMSGPKGTHYVTVVGYKTGANINSLSRSDILVMDPATGSIKTLAEAMKYNYGMNKVNAVRWFKSVK